MNSKSYFISELTFCDGQKQSINCALCERMLKNSFVFILHFNPLSKYCNVDLVGEKQIQIHINGIQIHTNGIHSGVPGNRGTCQIYNGNRKRAFFDAEKGVASKAFS